MSGSRWRGFSALVGVLLASCGEKEPPAEPVAIPTVMVMASDYAFQMPDTLAAGVTTFRLMNHGQEVHHLTLIRLADGQTMADFLKSMQGPPPAGIAFKGGPNVAGPGGAVEATLDLQPGNYVAICAIPSPDGQPHAAKGMVKGLTVVPAQGTAPAAAPTADVTIKLNDYGFETSRPLAAGRQVIRIENAAAQAHELVFVKLEPGRTVEDVARWAEKPEGPPPGSPLDGVSAMAPGEWNSVSVDLVPGEYGFICFLPDLKDGRPHIAHGMVKQFTVNP